MAVAIFAASRRKTPALEAILAPVDLSDQALVQALSDVCKELLSSSSSLIFQQRNSRLLIHKVKIFAALFEFLKESECVLPSVCSLCFKELYILIYRTKILLDYCSQSSRLWLLLQNSFISTRFQDLNQEISIILDVLPTEELGIPQDIEKELELMHRQAMKVRNFLDLQAEMIRYNLISFLEEFGRGERPNPSELRTVFFDNLGLRDVKTFRKEIEFLEEHIVSHEDIEISRSVLTEFVALARYTRFLLLGFDAQEEDSKTRKTLRRADTRGSFNIPIPKDFSCPITLDLMRDPVVISTGQTFDRSSINQWIQDGHCTCPKTRQPLPDTRLIPNKSLRNMISQWCSANSIPFDPSETLYPGQIPVVSFTKSAIEANKATVTLLISQLSSDSAVAKTIAVKELRLLARIGRENRVLIAESGAIPLLHKLFSSSDPIVQENAVTAILNLSINEKNKIKIMEVEGCLRSIIDVLIDGLTVESRENAAATLFSLSSVHDYKKKIASEKGAISGLADLLMNGSLRGQKDAVTAMFNLCTHQENCENLVLEGAPSALIASLSVDGIAEEAAGALALLVRQSTGAQAVAKDDSAVTKLIELMRRGTSQGKENAVATLLEVCRKGGTEAMDRVRRMPAVAGLLYAIATTGTKRARRKASSLVRFFQKRDIIQLSAMTAPNIQQPELELGHQRC